MNGTSRAVMGNMVAYPMPAPITVNKTMAIQYRRKMRRYSLISKRGPFPESNDGNNKVTNVQQAEFATNDSDTVAAGAVELTP